MPERLSPVSVKEDSIFLIHSSCTKARAIRWPFDGVPSSLEGQQIYVWNISRYSVPFLPAQSV
jgi:hypothetical protein